jgi:hypothetical protein
MASQVASDLENMDVNEESSDFAKKSAARHKAMKAKWATHKSEVSGPVEETSSHFWASFGPDAADAKARAVAATSVDEVKALELLATALRERAAAAASYLSPYDMKRSAADIKDAADAIAAAKQRLAPRKKFGFRKGAVKTVEAAAAAAPARTTEREVSGAKARPAGPGFAGLRDQVLVFADAADELNLEDLERCVVFCAKPLLALRLLNVRDTHVFAQAVSGPCYCIKASGCVVRAAARQFRIHDTRSTTFHVAAASPPIVEDCGDLAFAPYAATWDGSRPAFDAAAPPTEFAIDPAAWRNVKDFKWLKAEQSPNWRLLGEDAYGDVPERARAQAAELGLALLKP